MGECKFIWGREEINEYGVVRRNKCDVGCFKIKN